MPKLIQRYQCEYCKKDDFTNYRECLLHELDEHVGIPIETFETWKKLERRVRSASHTVSVTKNEETDAAFDEAIRDIAEFEEEHGITDKMANYRNYA